MVYLFGEHGVSVWFEYTEGWHVEVDLSLLQCLSKNSPLGYCSKACVNFGYCQPGIFLRRVDDVESLRDSLLLFSSPFYCTRISQHSSQFSRLYGSQFVCLHFYIFPEFSVYDIATCMSGTLTKQDLWKNFNIRDVHFFC